MAEQQQQLGLESLPEVAIQHIMQFLSYDEVAKCRAVSTRFNTLCKFLLNKGFRAVEKYHAKCLKDVKTKLPRRESERRDHPLARHCDILTAIETRISLLGMTFMKYVDLDLCCFIPGKVIDEIFAVLRSIQTERNPPRAYEVLQELRDISSMAMEYFDEKIVPSLKVKLPMSPLKINSAGFMSGLFSSGSGFSLSMRYCDTTSPPSTPLTRLSLPSASSEPAARVMPRSFVRDMETFSKSSKRLTQKTSRLVKDLKRQADAYKTAVESQNKKIVELDQRIDQQNELICQQNARLAEQEEKLAEMSRRLIENTNQLTDLSKEKLVLASPKVLVQGAGASSSSYRQQAASSSSPAQPPPAKRKRASETEVSGASKAKKEKI